MFEKLTHSEIWSAIDRLAARNKLTPSGLARKAGLDPTTFNKSKRRAPDGRERWPSMESFAKILAATNPKKNDHTKIGWFSNSQLTKVANEKRLIKIPVNKANRKFPFNFSQDAFRPSALTVFSSPKLIWLIEVINSS